MTGDSPTRFHGWRGDTKETEGGKPPPVGTFQHVSPGAAQDDITSFRHQLCAHPDSSLRRIYEHYRDDLICILEILEPYAILVELEPRNVIDTDGYQLMEIDPSAFAQILLDDIQSRGREAVIGLWECLYAIQKAHPHPNLLAILDELRHKGENLVDQILLDEYGTSLTPELKDIQEKHKQHLMEKTETLVEHRPPGTTLEPQRFLINERYVNLVVVSTNQFRQRPQNELIQTGVKHEKCLKKTQTGLEYISPNRLFRWNHQSQCVPHAVLVSGVPGIGKSTLMQKFVYDWVTGKHYQRFAFVFFYRFRDLNRLGEVSLEEMILHQYPHLESHIGNILHDPERLLFIFDGLDESIHQMDFKSSNLSNPKQRTPFGEIVVTLVRQRLLKGCSVLITSRPTRLASVDTGVFQRITDIMGFLHEDRLIFFNNFFGNEELSEKAFHYVQENDTLYTFCYIPSYCWIICTVLSMCFRSQPTITDQLMTSLPKTVTQLFVTFASNILANHSQNKDVGHTARELLTSIGRMAEHGVMNHMIVFNERHLESFSVRNDNHVFSSFMMESGQPPDVDYTFLHLTLQEFFAALVHFINYNPDRLQETLDDAESYEDGRAEIFLRFLCGLSDSSTRSMLKSHVGELSSQAARHVLTWIQRKIPEQRSDKQIEGNRELLNVFYYLCESRNKALVSQCIGSNKVVFSEVPLSPLDCSVLSFILQSCRETEEVNIYSCNIPSEGLRKFIPALHNIKSLRTKCLVPLPEDDSPVIRINRAPDALLGPIHNVVPSREVGPQSHTTGTLPPGPGTADLPPDSIVEIFLTPYSSCSSKGPEKSCWGCRAPVPVGKSFCDHCFSKAADEREGEDQHLKSLVKKVRKIFKQLNKERQYFPFLTELGDIISDEWGKMDKKSSMQSKILKLYIFREEEVKHLESAALVDAALMRLVRYVTLPLEDIFSFKDPLEIRIDSDLKRIYLTVGMACKPVLAIAVVSKAMETWSDSVDETLRGISSDVARSSPIQEIRLASAFLREASVDVIRLVARVMLKALSARHALWLSPWLADAASKQAWCQIPFEGTSFFSNMLDSAITRVTGGHTWVFNSAPRLRFIPTTLPCSEEKKADPISLRKLFIGARRSHSCSRCLTRTVFENPCPHLASGIRNNQTLRTLNLSDNFLEGPHFRDLMEALPTSRIEELHLDRNNLTDSSCPHLASGIRNNQTLRILNLSWNKLKCPHFSDLMEALTTSQIVELQLSYNYLSQEARKELQNLSNFRPRLNVFLE
ncbi:uncharacterized protein [Aquarana catesbeiana]|uniref:uncharacterized protein n=1 Tax=Aquarana catesbeiana TaxID=8400 RepID=UPI003CC9434B